MNVPGGTGTDTIKENVQVRYTGDWSSNSKLSSIANGYWEDPFLSFFNKVDPVPRRTSLICRGYYVRFRVCDYFVRSILEITEEPIQIVSLGCGMDTTFFRILPQFEGKVIRFFELDFDSVIQMKRAVIAENEILRVMQNGKLSLVSADLRSPELLKTALASAGFKFDATTLFYSECVVNYLQPKESEGILKWIVANVPKSVWLAYEQCYSSDGFGKVMVKHFETNGSPLQSLPSHPDMVSQKQQLESVGFTSQYVFNAWDAFLHLARCEDYPFPKIEQKQQFDEFEALLATCLHYSVRVGICGDCEPFSKLMLETESGISNLLRPKLPKLTTISGESLSVEYYELERKLTAHVALCNRSTLFVFGGSHENSRRSSTLEKVIIPSSISNSSDVKTEVVKDDRRLFERLYSSAVFHPRSNSFYIFGGRLSPNTLCDSDLVQICAKAPHVIKSLSFAESGCPQRRWRSSMVVVGNDLLLFGGKGYKEVFGDCWRFKFSVGSWSEIKDDHLPSPRHSHSMCADPKGKFAYCVGGLLKDEATLCLDAVFRYDVDEGDGKWTNIPTLSVYGRRIGHSCAIVNNTLCIVGGYGGNSSYDLEHFVSLINLKDQSVRILGMCSSIQYLPFGWTVSVMEEENSEVLVIYGGGGNCFSFGTHYNKFLFKFNLDKL